MTAPSIATAHLHCTRCKPCCQSKIKSYVDPSVIGRETTIPSRAAAEAIANSAMPPF